METFFVMSSISKFPKWYFCWSNPLKSQKQNPPAYLDPRQSLGKALLLLVFRLRLLILLLCNGKQNSSGLTFLAELMSVHENNKISYPCCSEQLKMNREKNKKETKQKTQPPQALYGLIHVEYCISIPARIKQMPVLWQHRYIWWRHHQVHKTNVNCIYMLYCL